MDIQVDLVMFYICRTGEHSKGMGIPVLRDRYRSTPSLRTDLVDYLCIPPCQPVLGLFVATHGKGVWQAPSPRPDGRTPALTAARCDSGLHLSTRHYIVGNPLSTSWESASRQNLMKEKLFRLSYGFWAHEIKWNYFYFRSLTNP